MAKWFGSAGACHCCGCSSDEDARLQLLALTGLTTLTVSGGPVYGSTSTDFRTGTCSPGFPDGNTYNSFSPFDFSAGQFATITSIATVLGYSDYPPTPLGGRNTMGSIEFLCTGTNVDSRGFATIFKILTLLERGIFSGAVNFSCVSGTPTYLLQVGATFRLYRYNATNALANPPSSGTDWTRTNTGDPEDTYTRNGSTASDGAQVVIKLEQILSPQLRTYTMSASTWVSYPTTSVTMWVPNPAIDWNGLTISGNATLS